VADRAQRGARATVTARPVLVNGEPGVVVWDRNGKPVSVMACTVIDDRIVEILSIVACRGHGGYMDRSPEVEQLAVAWLAGMKAGNAVAVASLFVENEATTVIGNGADQWFTGDAYTKKRWTLALASMAESPSSLVRLWAGPQATRAGSPIR
jgi:hypothetical protein